MKLRGSHRKAAGAGGRERQFGSSDWAAQLLSGSLTQTANQAAAYRCLSETQDLRMSTKRSFQRPKTWKQAMRSRHSVTHPLYDTPRSHQRKMGPVGSDTEKAPRHKKRKSTQTLKEHDVSNHPGPASSTCTPAQPHSRFLRAFRKPLAQRPG